MRKLCALSFGQLKRFATHFVKYRTTHRALPSGTPRMTTELRSGRRDSTIWKESVSAPPEDRFTILRHAVPARSGCYRERRMRLTLARGSPPKLGRFARIMSATWEGA